VEERLLPVNTIIGLVTPGDINPAVLHEAGFRLAGFEVPILTRSGDRVTVDVVLFNSTNSHFVLFEAKSGTGLDGKQARRYADVDPHNVVQAVHVSLSHVGTVVVEVAYACLGEHFDQIELAMTDAGVSFPVLYTSPSEVGLLRDSAASIALRSAFSSGPVKLIGPPPRLVPFDQDSPVDVIEPFVKAQLIAELSFRRPSITTPVLTERVAPYAALMARRARANLTSKVNEACRSIAQADPTTFQYQPPLPNEPAVMHLLKTPENNDPRGRTQTYQALTRRPGRRRPVPHIDPRQFDLLAELEVNDSPGETDSTQEEGDES
jgi:hypothetical protein